MAVAAGESASANIRPTQAVDRRRLWRAGRFAGFVAVVVLVAYVVLPGVFQAVVPRLLWPTADYPPYTLVQFHVTTQPKQIYYGQPASIHVRLSGMQVPHQASVVFVEPDGQRQRLAMLGQWQAQPVSLNADALR